MKFDEEDVHVSREFLRFHRLRCQEILMFTRPGVIADCIRQPLRPRCAEVPAIYEMRSKNLPPLETLVRQSKNNATVILGSRLVDQHPTLSPLSLELGRHP